MKLICLCLRLFSLISKNSPSFGNEAEVVPRVIVWLTLDRNEMLINESSVISCAAPFITLHFPEHGKTFNYFFNVLASRSETGKSITLNNCSPHGVKWAKSCLSFITLLFDSLVVRVGPCYERHPKPISRMWSLNCLATCHSIWFELQRVNVKPTDG